eukprot:CAMPEP_0118980684 /NCGR_PEP_ID=MMETSP1173-20130426/28900_1 /TAXON_ID=1034831 /ORGANISM="Rhizochromulina marina cf, Strain CCMP1243" /LENGTH=47 /DNA_ID= /DNA_START= /DNA_END= /DNA_ORIENTATION=
MTTRVPAWGTTATTGRWGNLVTTSALAVPRSMVNSRDVDAAPMEPRS